MYFDTGMVRKSVALGQEQTALNCTAYNFVLYAISGLFKNSDRTGIELRRDKFVIGSLFPNNADNALRIKLVDLFGTLVTLSYAFATAADLPSQFGADGIARRELSE
jgi:hypothetical protein